MSPAQIDAMTPAAPTSGARSGALLGAATAVSIVANYVFLLAAGRLLGSDGYGALGALLGLLAVVLLPAGALQMAVSREVSRHIARGDVDAAHAFGQSMLRLAFLASGPLLVVSLALAVPLDRLLNIDSLGVVALAMCTLGTALVFPVAMGILQGTQRFHALAAIYVFPWVLRLVVLAVVAAAGYRLGGAIFCTLLAAVAGTAAAVELVRTPGRRVTGPRPDLRAFFRYLGPVAAGLIGITLLTHVDILVVKARFSSDDAGAYAAASAFARVAFFVPGTILAVLFPRTAARQARGEDTADILGRSLLATAAFCGLLAVFYAAAGEGLLVMTFGSDFAAGGRILGPFALGMGLFSLANVLVGYHLSRGERRYAWIIALGVVAQIAVLAVVPTSLEGVVWANVLVGVALLAAHELLVGSSVPALRAAVRRLDADSRLRIRRVSTEGVLVVAGVTALVCGIFWPVVRHLGSTVVGTLGSDSTGSVWWFWQLKHESGFHLLGTTHHTLTGAPFGWDEGNGLNVQWMLPYYPGYLLTKLVGEVAAYNLVTLSGFVLSGATMYVLARYLGCGRLVSGWAALAFVVFPRHLAHAEHGSLVHLEVLALLLLALVAAVRRPGWPRYALVGAATLACWLTSGYFGTEALVTAAAFAVGTAVALGPRRGARIVVGCTACALAATALVSLDSFTSGVNRGAGLHRSVEDLSAGGLRLYELVVPADGNLVLGHRLDSFHQAHLHGTNHTEVSNDLGLLTIALLVVCLVFTWRRWPRLDLRARAATTGLFAAAVAGVLFALPSPITVAGRALWMPSRLLWEVVPAFRAPSRWMMLIAAAAIPLAALGLQALSAAVARRGPGRVGAGALVGAAMVFSFLELSISPARAHFRTDPVPPEYAAVARTPDGVLAEYPLGSSDVYRFWQRRHGRPLLNGAPADTQADAARLVLLDPATPGTAQALALLGVSAIVVHRHAIVDVEVAPRAPAGAPGYRLVGRYPDGQSVWQVVARPAPALVTLPGGFARPARQADGAVGYALTSSAGVGVLELAARRAGVVELAFEATPPAGARRALRLADAAGERSYPLTGRTAITVRVQVPRGRSQLLLKVDPPATSEADAIVLSTPHATAATGAAELHARPVASDPGF